MTENSKQRTETSGHGQRAGGRESEGRLSYSERGDRERLALIEGVLALLPSRSSWEGRAVFLAYLIASGTPEKREDEVWRQVADQRPNFRQHAEDVARERLDEGE